MKVIPCEIPDVLVIEPKVFRDDRGFFFESFNERSFQEATGVKVRFVQDNHSKSAQNVLRGLHYQTKPAAQAKLLRVVSGEIYDVAVDLRKTSPTLGRWVGVKLSAETNRQLYVPEGFAHGFIVLSETAEVLYKTSDYYSPKEERCIRWNDPTLAISWPTKSTPSLSVKDSQGLSFKEALLFD